LGEFCFSWWRVWVVDLLDLEEVLDSLLPAARLAWRVFPGALPAPWIRAISKEEVEMSRHPGDGPGGRKWKTAAADSGDSLVDWRVVDSVQVGVKRDRRELLWVYREE
jgi:hypothetical protein